MEGGNINDMLLKLGRDAAVKEGFTPTGRKVGIGIVANTSLYRLQYVDDKPGKLPEPYTGMYTRVEYAAKDLKEYLDNFWQESDAEAEKLRLKAHAERARKAAAKEKEAMSDPPVSLTQSFEGQEPAEA